jgi:hypothetical protein
MPSGPSCWIRRISWNRTAARVTGLAAKDLVGEKGVLFAGDSKAGIPRTLTEGHDPVETILVRKDGRPIDLHLLV